MHPLFDSHAHYDDHRFAEEFEGGVDGAIRAAHEAGVDYIANIGSSLRSSRNSVELADRYDFIYATVGLHPYDAQQIDAADLDSALHQVEELTKHGKVRAIGEIGLDYHYDGTDKERQSYFFSTQMEIAQKVGLPVIIHSRDAAGDTFDMIRRYPEVKGILHSYSGTAEMARQLCDMGWYISFSGPVTYKNAAKVKESAAIVPDDKLLIETDCPYLPPVPHRGELNYSGYLHFTCQGVADARGADYDTVAKLTYENAKRFFRIS